jgi:hypothetical protein
VDCRIGNSMSLIADFCNDNIIIPE